MKKPRQPDLPYLLAVRRGQEPGPKGFEWHYPNCNQCAMGLLHWLWPSKFEHQDETTLLPYEWSQRAASQLGLDVRAAHEAFWQAEIPLCMDREDITPAQVADLLEAAA